MMGAARGRCLKKAKTGRCLKRAKSCRRKGSAKRAPLVCRQGLSRDMSKGSGVSRSSAMYRYHNCVDDVRHGTRPLAGSRRRRRR